MRNQIILSVIIVFAMFTTTLTAQNGGMNIGRLQANESLQVGTTSESVVVLSDLIALPPLTNSEIQLIVDPVEGSIVYATESDILLVFDGEKWRRADGQNDSYLLPICPSSVTDIDGNTYSTVLIGTQCWMGENLKYLPAVVGSATGSLITQYYYVYGYEGTDVNAAKATANYGTYGVLYNWPAAMAGSATSSTNPSGVQGICPSGWHLPSDAEWTEMEDYMIAHGYNWDGSTTGNKIAKSLASTTGWISSSIEGTVGNNQTSNNITGFTARPGGYRTGQNGVGDFVEAELNGDWWSATADNSGWSWYRYLDNDGANVVRNNYNKTYGFSVRCVMD